MKFKIIAFVIAVLLLTALYLATNSGGTTSPAPTGGEGQGITLGR